MKKGSFFFLLGCCTIGGDDVEKVATIANTIQVEE